MANSAPTATAPTPSAPSAPSPSVPTTNVPTVESPADDSLTPDIPPVEDDEDDSGEESSNKIVWPGPTGPDGKNIPIDFYPDENAGEENLAELEKLGSPMWIADIHRIPAEKYFKGIHVKLRWNASNMRREADKLDLLADDAIKNPEKSKTIKCYQTALDKMKTLMSALKGQGVDVSAQLAELTALAVDDAEASDVM